MTTICLTHKVLLCFLLILSGMVQLPLHAQVNFKTTQWCLQLDASGKLTSMKSIKLQKEFLVADKATSLMSIKKDGKIHVSQSCIWKAKNSELILSYPQVEVEAKLKVQQRENYISFELIQLTKAEMIDLILWGPYPTSIADTVLLIAGGIMGK